ncbi:MAG: hypothetical protein DVB25_02885 [Verrucomicrobia bacterium]|nr:MAG: hypothetical protein DVB25_02885 [Verrucomicrobiota bacterium]
MKKAERDGTFDKTTYEAYLNKLTGRDVQLEHEARVHTEARDLFRPNLEEDNIPFATGDGSPILPGSKDEDSRYLELAKDPERNYTELRGLVERAAKAAGYNTRAYHGSKLSDLFDFFDPDKIRSQEAGVGFFFATDFRRAKLYADKEGGHLYEVFIKQSNPLNTEVDYPSTPANHKEVFEQTLEGISRLLHLSKTENDVFKAYLNKYHEGAEPNRPRNFFSVKVFRVDLEAGFKRLFFVSSW